jgi:hypothetical protein
MNKEELKEQLPSIIAFLRAMSLNHPESIDDQLLEHLEMACKNDVTLEELHRSLEAVRPKLVQTGTRRSG